jgi:hypothetical protein
MEIGRTYQTGTGFAGLRRQAAPVQYSTISGAFMSLRAIQKIATLNRQPIRADRVIITENPVNKEKMYGSRITPGSRSA